MTIAARSATVACDGKLAGTSLFCKQTVLLDLSHAHSHQMSCAFNNAMNRAGWSEPFHDDHGYIHLCPSCTATWRAPRQPKDEESTS